MTSSATDNEDRESQLRAAGKPGHLRRWLGQLAVLVTLAAGLPTLGAFGGAHAWPLELLSHFRVQYALALLVLVIVLLAVGRYGWAAVAAVLLALNAWQIAPFALPLGAESTVVDGASFKLVSVNVLSSNRSPERVVEFLRDADPDVIVVLEFTPEWERRLSVLEATHPHTALRSSGGNFGIGLYSRLPIEDVEWVPLSESNEAVAVRVRVDGQLVTVIGAHPFPPFGAPGSSLRDQQLRQVAKFAASLRGPAIVAGDLNITPFSPVFDEFLAAAKLRDPRRGQGLLTTWPANRLPLRIPIDHVLVGEGVSARLSTGPTVGSDHLPVIAEIRLKPASEIR